MLWIKIVVVVLLLASVVSLFMALTSMLKGNNDGRKTVRALTWRVSFSVAAFLLLVLSMFMGWVKPHGVVPTPQPSMTAPSNVAPSSTTP